MAQGSPSVPDLNLEDEDVPLPLVARMALNPQRWEIQLAEFARIKGLVIPPLAADDDYAALAAKHLSLRTRAADLEREHRETVTAIARGFVAHRNETIERHAQALVNGLAHSEAFNGFEELRERQVRLQGEMEVYSEAVRIIRGRMEEVRGERSIDAADIAAPFHRAAAARIAAACKALGEALTEEEAIRSVVTFSGYDDRLRSFSGFASGFFGRMAANDSSMLGELERVAREYAG